MAKGKKGKTKIGLRRRKDAENVVKEQERPEEDDVSSYSTEPQENITAFLKAEEVQDLLVVLQTKDLNDLPVLIGAAILGKVDLVKRFLREGCGLECCDQDGMTPYLWAVKCKNIELIELLTARGADLTTEDVNGDNALIHAVRSTTWDEESVIDYFRTNREYFDVNFKNKTGSTAFHFCVRRNWLKLCEMLIDAGADVNGINTRGLSGLMMAASKGQEQMVEMLLRHRADPYMEDERGCTALCYGISRLQQKKADLSSQTVSNLFDAFGPLEREKYLIRRLHILMNPGKRSEAGNVIDTFLSPVFSFFVKRIHGGLGMLLKAKVFDIVFQALKNHIGQLDYTISILGVLSEILNYCDCCVNITNPGISEDDLYQAFLNSQCPKMCIVILKHSGMSNLRTIASPTFLPLFLVCPSNSAGRKWLQDHHATLQPFYQKFMEFGNIKYNLHVDDVHLKSVKKRVKNFKNLMMKLLNGDNIIGKAEPCEAHFDSAYEKENAIEKEDALSKKTRRRTKIRITKKGSLDIAKPFKETINESMSKPTSDKNSSVNQKCIRPSREIIKSTKSGYDPSDLIGLLATSRSAVSSDDSDLGNSRSDSRLLTDVEKEKRSRQVVAAMKTIFSTKEVDEVSTTCLTSKISEDSVEPTRKDLTPALNYLQSLFEDLTSKHRKVWNYERLNNYSDRSTPEGEDDGVQLMKLKIVLSQLEEYYLNSLTEEWDQLIKTIRDKEWYNEEASNDVISKLQEMLLKNESTITDKLRKIEEEESKARYLERKTLQSEKGSNQRFSGEVQVILDRTEDTNNAFGSRCAFHNPVEADLFLNKRAAFSLNNLRKISSQSRLFDVEKKENVENSLSQGSNNAGLELNTIYLNKSYKSDSHSEIVSIGSKTGSSQSIPTPRTEEERKEQYCLWSKMADNPLERFHKTVRQMNEPAFRICSKSSCWALEISNLKKMINNSHVQYGEILLPNPLKSGKILLPYGETGYFGSVEMGMDQKGNPVAVKQVKKSFPTSVDILSNIMIRLRKINYKYLLPFYMSEGFEPIIATPLMDFNLGQYILHLKTNCMLELKARDIIKQVIAGLHYLHIQKPPIVHGNLKPSNIFVDSSGTMKVAEFGISVALYLKKPAPPCSMIWWPGEVITTYIKMNKLRCTLSADVATAGLLIHFILSGGQHPFGQQVKEIVDNLILGKWNLVTSDNDADDLISWMLVFLPENRPITPAIVRHIYFWSMDKRWRFLLTCAGAATESGATPHDISQLHNFLDIKAKENNIQGDWKTLIVTYFPNCKETIKNFSSTLTGLLSFIRQSLEERKRYAQGSIRNGSLFEEERLTPGERFLKSITQSNISCERSPESSWYIPYYCDLRSFFFSAFPVISLSIYRMLERTQWMESPLFAQFNEPYDLT